MAYFISRDPKFISQQVYEAFQADLHSLLNKKQYDESAVWYLACYKEINGLTFAELANRYENYKEATVPTEIVKLFNKVKGVDAPTSTNAPAHFETPPRKPVTVRVNVDLYYEIDTKNLPVWMNGDAITKAVEEAFEDAGSPTFASLSSVLNQAPKEVIINEFAFAH